MYASFREQLAAAPAEGLVVVGLSTLGGDAEVARMMGEDVRFHSEVDAGRRFVFSWQGSDLFGRRDLHELFRPAQSVSYSRDTPDDS
jgi:hypothetical protein